MEIKVANKSNPNSVAGAIAAMIKENERAEITCVGAGALNQSIKAICIARGFVAPLGYDLICVPSFKQIELDGMDRTAMKITVEIRK